MRIVDTVLGLWSLMLACKDESFEVQLIYSRIHDDRERCVEPGLDRPAPQRRAVAQPRRGLNGLGAPYRAPP